MDKLKRVVVASVVAVTAVGVTLAAGMGLSAASARPISTTTGATTDPTVRTTATTVPVPTAPNPTTTAPPPTTTPPVCVTATATSAVAAFADGDETEAEAVKALLRTWAKTLSVDEPSAADMAALYADKAVLHPTLSPVVRTSRAEIKEYFEKDFFPKKPKLDVDKGVDRKQIEIRGTVAIDSGIYTFTDKDGKVIAKARYVFVYEKTKCGWIIIHHSSSLLPEKKE
jgi:uncharacterized protein (TIGR02246 family)